MVTKIVVVVVVDVLSSMSRQQVDERKPFFSLLLINVWRNTVAAAVEAKIARQRAELLMLMLSLLLLMISLLLLLLLSIRYRRILLISSLAAVNPSKDQN